MEDAVLSVVVKDADTVWNLVQKGLKQYGPPAALCAPKVGRVGASRRGVGCMHNRVGHSEAAPAAGL